MADALESLVTQQAPLERHEVTQLEDWLSALEEDCACFGATGEDRVRMSGIRNRISLERFRTLNPKGGDSDV